MKERKESRIACPIFQKQEAVIKDITSRINAIQGATGKAAFAQELQKEVNVLLSCQDYKKESLDCKNCRFIAALRKKTADLIMKAKKLEQ